MADNLHKQRAFHIENFRGMDYSSSKIKASPYRAVDGYNWIRKNGSNQKRNGWKQITDKLGGHINGVFPYTDSNGNEEALVFTNNTAYRMYQSGGRWEVTQTDLFDGDGTGVMEPRRSGSNPVVLTGLADRRLQAAYQNDKIFIPAGGYYQYNTSQKRLYELTNYHYTSVPDNFTDIGSGEDLITAAEQKEMANTYNVLSKIYDNYKTNGVGYIPTVQTIVDSDPYEYYRQQSYPYNRVTTASIEGVNAISNVRAIKVNQTPKLRADNEKYKESEQGYGSWFINGSGNMTGTTLISISQKIGNNKSLMVVNQNGEKVLYKYTGEKRIAVSGIKNEYLGTSSVSGYIFSFTKCVSPEENVFNFSKVSNSLSYKSIDGDTYAKVDNSPIKVGANSLVLWIEGSTLNPGVYTTVTQYGLAGYADRIFLANPTSGKKNLCWYSENDNFAYFPDNYTVTVGNDKTPVIGFLRLADNVLALFKPKGIMEPSISYMTGSLQTSGTAGTSSYKQTAVFSFREGAQTESAANGFCTAILPGDSVFLSKDGVFGIVMQENLATSVRTTRERSRLIKPRLEKLNMENSSCYPFEGKLFVSDGVNAYIADTEQKLTVDENIAWQYEWYFWKNLPARVWAELGGRLVFGTSDGRICQLDDDEEETYNDVTFETTAEGAVALADGSDKIFVTADGSIITALANSTKVELVFDTDTYIQKRVYGHIEGQEYGWKNVPFTVSFDNGTFTVESGDYVPEAGDYFYSGENIYQIHEVDENGFTVEEDTTGFSSTSAVLAEKIETGKTCYASVTGEQNFKLTDEKGNIQFLAGTGNLLLRIYHAEPVKALWVSPTLDFGAETYRKTLLGITLTANEQAGRIKFGYLTRNRKGEETTPRFGDLDFGDIDFSNFTTDEYNTAAISTRMHERNFSFLQFFILSEDDKNCSIESATLNYKYTAKNRGIG